MYGAGDGDGSKGADADNSEMMCTRHFPGVGFLVPLRSSVEIKPVAAFLKCRFVHLIIPFKNQSKSYVKQPLGGRRRRRRKRENKR